MSYGWLDSFRVGQWLSLRAFLLRERKNVPARVRTIRDELERIGTITVIYDKVDTVSGADTTNSNTTVKKLATEKRLGFQIGSNYDDIFQGVPGYQVPEVKPPAYAAPSLLKLLQAYVSLGGNPLDISLFLTPDIALYVQNSDKITSQPHGGYVSVKSGFEGESPFNFTASGSNPLIKSRTNRTKSRSNEGGQWGDDISRARLFANREIMTKRNRIEENILKLCDLREQLYLELMDTVRLALWGTFKESGQEMTFLNEPDFTKYPESPMTLIKAQDYHLFSIIAKIDGNIFNTQEIGNLVYLDTTSETVTKNIKSYEDTPGPKLNIFPDDPQEANTAY